MIIVRMTSIMGVFLARKANALSFRKLYQGSTKEKQADMCIIETNLIQVGEALKDTFKRSLFHFIIDDSKRPS